MTDLIKVESVDGIFLANIRDQQIVSLYREMKHAAENNRGKLGNAADINLEDYKKTVITFNNGGSWQPLLHPATDVSGQTITCSGCSLHLFLDSAHLLQGTIAPKTALGIIVAHGTIGNRLSHSSIGVYISSDGGINWIHARTGQHRIALGNHGGIILLADATKPTRTLLYSYDHGKQFDPVHFAPEGNEVTVTSLKSDYSDPSSIKFFLTGLKHTIGGTKGVAMLIDFSRNNLPECRLISNPGTRNSDYEYFQIIRNNSSDCVLGKKDTYIRRRPAAHCHVKNPEGFLVL
jgi:Sortilin, neurotensin receptor 3,/Sortilin, neurotensin receptor 3, C-terminal